MIPHIYRPEPPTAEYPQWICTDAGSNATATSTIAVRPSSERLNRVNSITHRLAPIHLLALQASIDSIVIEEDDEERPTAFAQKQAKRLTEDAAVILDTNFPSAHVATGPNGSLRISWKNIDKELRLVCGGSSKNRTYIYREQGKNHEITESFDGYMLATMVRWLLE